MERIYMVENLKATFQKDAVFAAIDCFEDSPVYEVVEEEYLDLCEEAKDLAEPVGILGFGTLPKKAASAAYPEGTRVIYAVLSIGDEMKQRSSQAFAEGDYIQGMLWDAIADEALFSLEKKMIEKLKEVCREHNVGIVRRLEAPHDISMEAQRAAWECLELEKRLGIGISCGYMFYPVKTSCQVFVISENTKEFHAEHDCRKCPNLKCPRRNVKPSKVIVSTKKGDSEILVQPGESLMTALLREEFYISAVCGGKGRCGKCKVQVISGDAYMTEEDRAVFSEQELEAGWRLSCRLYPTDDLKIVFALEDESQFEAVSEFKAETESIGQKRKEAIEADAHESDQACVYDIAVDIGTTTLAFAAVARDSGRILASATRINRQRKYGADVISRIKASADGKKQELRACIREDLSLGISELARMVAPKCKPGRLILAGNTTMGHLLMGYDCQSLGVYPFTPVHISLIRGDRRQIIGAHAAAADIETNTDTVTGTAMDTVADTEILPGISTFVGADIVSGLYACGFDQKEEICLLVDLGTNGEMALGNKERILVTSTAAGPAFEGGNITWGTGSIPGAICSVKIADGQAEVQTIGDQHPSGICGTGVVEVTAELLKEELIDETGLLDEEYFDDGYPLAETADGKMIVFEQKDVREIQLAKAAVRAGVETLILRYGISKEQISRVYLAGGFGYRLDTEKATAIGMLPEELQDRIEAVGNSSLAGAVKYAGDPGGESALQRLIHVSEEIALSSDKDFNTFYMDFMMFGNDV